MAGAGKSAQEMATVTGMPAAKALLRVKEILRERDIWTDVERRSMLLDDLYDLKRRVQDQLENVEWLDDKQITALAKVIQTLDEGLERNGKIQEELVQQVTNAQSASMLRLIDAAFKRAKKILTDQYPEVPFERVQEAFQKGLTEAANLVD
jgi:hypothetical protein